MIGTAIAGALAGSYAVSTFLAVRGWHDWFARGAVWRTPGSAPLLTFDDGPHPERTPAILDLLRNAKVRSMFFVVGERVARHPDLVRRIADEGHEIGNHSWTHPSMALRSRMAIEDQLDRCQEAVQRSTGKTPRWFRPPFGHRDFRVYRAARARGLTPMLWSVDSFDYLGRATDRIVRRVEQAGAGDIVLLHDGSPRATNTVPAMTQWLTASAGRALADPSSRPL